METYTNAEKLAAVLSTWAKPAVSKIAADKFSSLSWMQSLQHGIVNLGLVHDGYNISMDLEPLISPAVNAMVEPVIKRNLSKIPDESIPTVARGILDQWDKAGCVSLLDGLVVLDSTDLRELRKLIDLNLPMSEVSTYQVITDEQQ